MIKLTIQGKDEEISQVQIQEGTNLGIIANSYGLGTQLISVIDTSKVIKRIKNLVNVINFASGRNTNTDEETVQYINSQWYRNHITELSSIVWALEAMTGNKYTVDFKSDLTVEVANI